MEIENFDELVREVDLLFDLLDDLDAIFPKGQVEPVPLPQWRRRSFIRALTALLEAHINHVRRLAIAFEGAKRIELSLGEQYLLSEKSFDLSRSGHVKETSRRWSGLLANFRFSLELMNKIYMTDFRPRYDMVEFRCLRDSVDVRHRITHPRRRSDLQVSDDELLDAHRAQLWFMENTIWDKDGVPCSPSLTAFKESITLDEAHEIVRHHVLTSRRNDGSTSGHSDR